MFIYDIKLTTISEKQQKLNPTIETVLEKSENTIFFLAPNKKKLITRITQPGPKLLQVKFTGSFPAIELPVFQFIT